MLNIQRTPRDRPIDLDERLRRTQEALRYVRVNERGAVILLEREDQATEPDVRRIYPGFAALQLYLLNDRRFEARYVQQPIVFSVAGTLDYEHSINGVKTMVRSLVAASRATSDLSRTSNAAALRRESAFHREYPGVYTIVRTAVLEQLAALRKTLLNNRLLEYIFTQRWAKNSAILRQLGALERRIMEWRSQLKRGGVLSRSQSNEIAQSIAQEVLDNIVPDLLTEARENAGEAGVVEEREEEEEAEVQRVPTPPPPSTPARRQPRTPVKPTIVKSEPESAERDTEGEPEEPDLEEFDINALYGEGEF